MKIVTVLILALLAFPALALEPGEALNDPANEARARALMAELRCLVCQSEAIDASPAPFAAEVRALVREQVASGRSDAEIKEFLTARYGDAILYRPRLTPATWVLWLGPFVALGLGAIVVIVAVRSAARGGESVAPLSDEEKHTLEDLLNNDSQTPL